MAGGLIQWGRMDEKVKGLTARQDAHEGWDWHAGMDLRMDAHETRVAGVLATIQANQVRDQATLQEILRRVEK